MSNATLAQVGLEAATLDRTAAPCSDFYQFACGGWLAKTEIPADQAEWGRFNEIDDRGKLLIRGLLEDDAKGVTTDPASVQLGNYYASCMDVATMDKAGIKPIKALLATTMGVKDNKTWLAALIALHKLGFPAVFFGSAGADAKDSTTNVYSLDVAGLELPDRDYYINPDFKDRVEAYRTHAAKILALAGMPAAKTAAAANDIIAIETAIAKLTKTATERRDPQASYNPTYAAALAKTVKSIDWAAYWKGLDLKPGAKIIVGTPAFFSQLDALHAQFTPAQWASYFTYHVVSWQSMSLGTAIDDEDFQLQKVLSGVTAQRERYKRCIDETTGALGELLGQQYAAKYFPGASKDTAIRLVDAIVATMGDNFATVEWMSPETRAYAAGKLGKLVRMIGYPDKWKTYDFVVKRDDFDGNEQRSMAFNAHRYATRAGTPVDRSEWGMNSFTVNAYYNPVANNTVLPAGILQMPFFATDRSVAANLGGIGMVIGHELTHGFDDQGALYDAAGNLKDWWQPGDKAKFDAKTACVADQYSTFEVLPKQFVNGHLTLGEDIADIGGIKTAFHAYRALRKGAATPTVADGFTEDQQFFLGVGQAWCDKERPTALQAALTADPHAPAKFRVYGALRNLHEFADAFHCAPGTPMHPTNACQVW